MNCKSPLCSEKADRLVKLITETRNVVGRNAKIELLTDIITCAGCFPTVEAIGPRMKNFGINALQQQGFRRPFHHRVEPVALDSEEAQAHFAGKPN